MNPRERILAACVVGVLVLGGLATAVKWGVVERWNSLHDKIAKAQAEQQKLNERLGQARLAEQRWSALTPLAHNEDRGEEWFREDMSDLLDQHGLGEDCTVRNLPQRKLKSEFTEVRLSIQTRGTLRQVVGFMVDFYRRKYMARLDQVNLSAEEQGRRARPGAGGRNRGSGRAAGGAPAESPPSDPDGPKLNVSITATAVVLPKLGDLPQGIGPLGAPDDAEWLGRLSQPPAAYEAILAQNFFKEWQPPVIVTPPPDSTGHREVVTDAQPGQITPPSPPAPNKVLTAVTSTYGKLAAYVRDTDRRDLPPEKVELNKPVHDGTLVLVDPRGMVVQVPAAPSGAPGFKYYFYKLGAPFSERKELDPQAYPDLHAALERALGQ